MSKKKSTQKYRINLDFLDTFRFGIIFGGLGIIFWGSINFIDVWTDHIILDVLIRSLFLVYVRRIDDFN